MAPVEWYEWIFPGLLAGWILYQGVEYLRHR